MRSFLRYLKSRHEILAAEAAECGLPAPTLLGDLGGGLLLLSVFALATVAIAALPAGGLFQ